MLTRKGVYPYSYMDNWKKFEETTYHPRKDISEDDFQFIHDL